MFMSLEEHDLKVVIDAMEEKKVVANETIITEGEPGEVLYVVESGESTCSKIIDGHSKVLKNSNREMYLGSWLYFIMLQGQPLS